MNKQVGFTIVELMIATSIFAIILLVISFAALAIGRNFYKGVTSSRAQEAARSTMDNIIRPLEFTGVDKTENITGSGSGRGGAYCVGTVRFTFVIDRQVSDVNDPLGKHKQKHALWQDKPKTPLPCKGVDLELDNPSLDPLALGTEGKELAPSGMRLTDLQINNIATRYYSVKIGVIAGDDEIIERVSANNPTGDPSKFQCMDSAKGGQFCAAAALATTVYRRVTQ